MDSDNHQISATVVVPTTGDRGPLLPFSIGSVLQQSIQNIEVFVIGDGVSDQTRHTINSIVSSDPRVRFFDNPKHERRGEPHRHEALKSARGRIVCYLCDRDLMLPNHVDHMLSALSDADFAHSLAVRKAQGDGFRIRELRDLTRLEYRNAAKLLIPLSMVGHTMSFYRDLPFGWRTTPPGIATDEYMWKQFLDIRECRVAFIPIPTIIYLKRGDHPGLSTAERLAEIEPLFQIYINADGANRYVGDLLSDLVSRSSARNNLREFLRAIASKLPAGWKTSPRARM
jgi:glycosyltransferase involved in cell wall biosynthesis